MAEDGVSENRRDVNVDVLARLLARNRFMPVPPAELFEIGDGDFSAIGLEFLRHFVKIGGLRPDMRVLDIGCGLGRIALPLTQYLDERGSYFGFDVARQAVEWCARTISPAYPAFRFAHLDWHQPLYNPQGALRFAKKAPLPIERGPYDFIIMTSVLTHLSRYDMQVYLANLPRLLTPGGRVFATMFVLDRRRLRPGDVRPRYDFLGRGRSAKGMHFLDPANPHAAVAHELDSFVEQLRRFGLQLLAPVRYGNWDAVRRAPHFQDICLFGRAAKTTTVSAPASAGSPG